MTTASAITSFVRPGSAVGAEYWVHIEQVLPPDDTASLGEVAELVDEIYGTSPCGAEEETTTANQADPKKEVEPPLTEEQLAEIIRRQFRPGLCGLNFNGDYPTQIKVAIAHPGEAYKLRLTNGRIDKTITVEEPIDRTIVVENAESVDLNFPVVSGGSFVWRGSVYGKTGNMTGPPITLTGRTLSWGQSLSGSIAASYQTRYDLVDVTVLGDDKGEPGECRAICFYHGLVDDIDLESPDIDNDDGLEVYRQPFCGYANVQTGDPDGDEVTCYQDVSYVYRCQCSNKEAYQHTETVEVPCPPDIRCQFGMDTCSAFLGHRTVLGGYVDCGEPSEGLDDPAYRNEKCCDTAANPPKCKTTYSKNPGGVPLDPEVETAYRREYGNKLKIVAVSPADGDCGVTKTTIAVYAKNCCDEAEPLVWDAEKSVEVLADGTYGYVFVIGGGPPYYWSIRGQDMTFDGQHLRDAVTQSPVIQVYAGELSCGRGQIEVTDGCSIASGAVISTTGHWVDEGADVDCHLVGPMADLGGLTRHYFAENGGLRQHEYYMIPGISKSETFNFSGCEECQNLPYYQGDLPYSASAPCNTTLPDGFPCEYDPPYFLCFWIVSRSWERWVC